MREAVFIVSRDTHGDRQFRLVDAQNIFSCGGDAFRRVLITAVSTEMPWPSFRYLNATGSTPPPPPQSSTFKIKNIVCEVLFIGALCRHHRWASWLDNGDVILWCHDRRAFLLVNGGWCHDVSTKTPCDWIGVTQWCQTRKLLLLDHPHCHDLTKQRLFMLRILDRQQLWSDLFMYIVFLC